MQAKRCRACGSTRGALSRVRHREVAFNGSKCRKCDSPPPPLFHQWTTRAIPTFSSCRRCFFGEASTFPTSHVLRFEYSVFFFLTVDMRPANTPLAPTWSGCV